MDRRTLPLSRAVVAARRQRPAALESCRSTLRRSGPSSARRPDRPASRVECRTTCKHTCIHTSMAADVRLPRAARRAQLIEAAASAFLGRRLREHVDGGRRPGGRGQPADRVPQLRVQGGPLPPGPAPACCVDLGEAFSGLSFEDVAERGAATVILPVARPTPTRSGCCGATPGTQPPFEDLAERVPDLRDGLRPGDPERRSSPTRCASTGRPAAPAPTSSTASATGSTTATRPATTELAAIDVRAGCAALAAAWVGRRRLSRRRLTPASDVDDPVDLGVGDDERRAERQRVGRRSPG